MLDVQITEAEATELRGKGIDILTSHVVEQTAARNVSNHPADIEATAKSQVEAEAKAKADAEAAEAAKAPKKPEEKQGGLQKRIDELTRQAHDQRRRAEAEAAAREKAEDDARQLREQLASRDRPALVEPKREDFDSTDEFETARIDYKLALKTQHDADEKAKTDKADATKREQEEADRKRADAITAATDRLAAKQAEAREKYPDFDAVISSDIRLQPQVALALLNSDQSAELQYHFGKNPELVQELNGLDQASMLKRLGQIELNLAAKTADNGAGDQPRGADGKFLPKGEEAKGAKDVSSASAPITPLGSSAEGARKDPKDMTQPEYEAWRTSGGGK